MYKNIYYRTAYNEKIKTSIKIQANKSCVVHVYDRIFFNKNEVDL